MEPDWRHAVGVLVLAIALIVSVNLSGEGAVDFEVENPPVFLVLMESTRPDHLGCYGYERDTAPEICSVAEDGVLFENAYSQGTRTYVAVPSMLTSRPPSEVGLKNFSYSLDDSALTVGEVLNESRGYVSRSHRFHVPIPQIEEKGSIDISRDRPQYHQLFLREPHLPYDPEKRFRKWENSSLEKIPLLRGRGDFETLPISENATREEVIGFYDAEIREADHEFERMLDRMKEQGIYNESMIIIVADHGEYFGEEGRWRHGGPPLEPVTHIPMIVKFPQNRFAGKIVEQPVRQVDIVPTIYDVIGMSEHPETVGSSLIPAVKGEEREVTVFSAAWPFRTWSVRNSTHNYILQNPGPICEGEDTVRKADLYRLGEVYDPGNRMEEPPSMEEELCRIYTEGVEERYEGNTSVDHSREMKERLESLGYLG